MYEADLSVSVVSFLVDRYGIYVSQMTTNMFHLSQALPGSFLIHDVSPGLYLA
jgi:hypothetical protein